ncbi:hypothetical protein JW962_02340 [Candidatus Dojkabacteria bacterium]|nr:hypothetical protein [Candidatus Dojkabacteria bacterium]
MDFGAFASILLEASNARDLIHRLSLESGPLMVRQMVSPQFGKDKIYIQQPAANEDTRIVSGSRFARMYTCAEPWGQLQELRARVEVLCNGDKDYIELTNPQIFKDGKYLDVSSFTDWGLPFVSQTKNPETVNLVVAGRDKYAVLKEVDGSPVLSFGFRIQPVRHAQEVQYPTWIEVGAIELSDETNNDISALKTFFS